MSITDQLPDDDDFDLIDLEFFGDDLTAANGPPIAVAPPPRPRRPQTPTTVLEGDLRSVSLASVLHLAESDAIDGVLLIGDDRLIGLCRGLVVSARAGKLAGLSALNSMFFLDRGAFRLIAGDPAEGAPFGSAIELTIEACRIVDEWSRLSPMVLRVTPLFDGRSVSRPVDDLMLMLDGSSSVGDLVGERGYSPVLIISDLLEALREGIVETVARADRGPPPADGRPSPEDFNELLDEGRAHMRSGDLVRAERTLRRAVRAQPENRLARQNLRRVVQLRALNARA
ncbi:MAG: DUF4388 domain-containing protein [Nannocystaceae bacterium]|nr:DUF4388 domain-containing protein [Myxococcales bacterium]